LTARAKTDKYPKARNKERDSTFAEPIDLDF
jgi:hypothetical protein